MRHKPNIEHLNYAVLSKESGKIYLFRFKTQVADFIGVSTKTLERVKDYQNELFSVHIVANVVTKAGKRL